MSNRAQRRAALAGQTFYRVVPMLRDDDGTLVDSAQESVIDTKIGDVHVVRVPNTTSVQKAREIERKLTEIVGEPCLVVTRNIEFCRIERVGASEMARLVGEAEQATGIEAKQVAEEVPESEGG